MASDLTVYLDDRPGQVAAVGSVLGKAGVNIDGGFALVVGGQGIMHLLTDDPETAVRVLEQADFEVREQRDVLVVEVEDRPGALGEITARIASGGVNVTVFYLATRTRLVLGAEDLEAARAALAA
jgi:hypothetical protein